MKQTAKKLFTAFAVSFFAATVFAADTNELALIPLPQKVQQLGGAFHLTPQTRIYADWSSRKTAKLLAERLRQSTGYPLKVKTKFFSSTAIPNCILLTTKNANTNLGTEGYELSVATNSVVIRAPTQVGLFYGGQTLLQLLPPQIFSTNVVANENWQIPCVQIEDLPRFQWRGLMLDVSRHFYNVAEVEKFLDEMALYKLNHFHWHLTDDQGWRIEIKKYPKLTQIGARRTHSDIEPPDKEIHAHPAWAEPTADKFGPDGRYGGFYTQKNIREVVAYAAARHITVVPEIEMPGHSIAALTAYPQFSSGPGIYDPANPGTFTFLENILNEVFQLFPGKYIHIGGDEVRKDYWKKSADCQALMKRKGLKNEDELQSWFTRRMEKFINAHGKTLIGWSEILKGGLATNAVVMDWIGGGKQAAEAGHDAVMTPSAYCYLDHYQSTNHATEPRAIGGFLPLEKVYSFEPVPTNLPAQFQSHILGAQGNLWTEYVASLPHAQYMIFPRMCALAEVDWSAKNARDWDDFRQRLKVDEQRLDELGVNYRHDGGVQPRTTCVTNQFINAKISLDYPGFCGLSVDSLGKKKFPLVAINPPDEPWQPTRAEFSGTRVEYRRPGIADSEPPRWAIEIETNQILLESHWSVEDPPEPLEFETRNSSCHATLLGWINQNGSIQLPAILNFPGQGTFRISSKPKGAVSLGYDSKSGNAGYVKITFPGATRENPARTYRLQVAAIYPKVLGIDADAQFDGFRRDWLNILQLNPQLHTLANNASGATCGFCYYEYADIAKETPPLADGLTALDLVRLTLDRIIAGGKAYGMPGYGAFPEYASDTLPSLLIAAEDYVEGSKDNRWLAANYGHLKSWTDTMLSTDHEGNGLIEYTLSGNSQSWPHKIKFRPSNWWDCINFGHEDAYANALAYRALLGMEQLAKQSNHPDDQARYQAAAAKLKANYFKTFYDPATGVMAGWRSSDGQLHDYYFLWVNGIAIHYGLVPKDKANAIMDRLLAKMKEVGYTNFDLGLPGNLIPVARKDYWDPRHRFGGSTNADGSDGFQIYENGGATACFAYFTLAALYDLGRIQDGDRILFPMLESFDKGNFQGWGSDGMSRDWITWDGTCWGYEGFLTDNYYTLLAVLDREMALKNAGLRAPQR
jgi:hexosaminidase